MKFRVISPIYRALLSATRGDREAMAMKGCSAFPKPQHPRNLTIILFSIISRTLVGVVLPLCRGAVGVNVKTVLFQIIQFSISTQFTGQNSCLSSN